MYTRASFKHSYRIAFDYVCSISIRIVCQRGILYKTTFIVWHGSCHSFTHSHPHSHECMFVRFVSFKATSTYVCALILMRNFVIKFFGRMVCGGSVGGLVKFSGILSGKVLMIVMILFSCESNLIPCYNMFYLKFGGVLFIHTRIHTNGAIMCIMCFDTEMPLEIY